ncbi:MAG: 4Fe-4S binding protein [Candidatus Sabulitectum sp.]|nr:4Fe-4S binding protein [Candidatus Sabulitectum sp.]
MAGKSVGRVVLYFVVLVVAVVSLSSFSVALWGEKPEILPEDVELIIQESMTIREFGEANGLSNPVLKEVFNLVTPEDMQGLLSSTDVPMENISVEVNKVLALESENASKNWIKIVLKFGLWAVYLIAVFLLLRKGKITPRLRKGLLIGAVVLFGIILGADPSPMGTVKDAIVLFGQTRVIFPPRMVAFVLMLAGGILLANKFLCAWGCQFGTLQDLIFRLNRDSRDRRGILPQVKVPFALSNSIRIAFFVFMTAAAILWVFDIVNLIDPFKIFKPEFLGITGIVSVSLLLIASLFVYRPWCHFLCPYGLVGWLVEKISINRIHVNYESCIACDACSKACPSTAMEAILKRKKTIPDCFSCGTCIGVCPTQSISFKKGKRLVPPPGKFGE